MDLSAEPEDISFGEKEYSPYLQRGYPQQVFWGDTHVHTSYSTDAGMIGCLLGPEEAYRFALGEIVEANPELLRTDFGREIFELVRSGDYGAAYTLWGTYMAAGNDPLAGQDALTRSMWERITEAADSPVGSALPTHVAKSASRRRSSWSFRSS